MTEIRATYLVGGELAATRPRGVDRARHSATSRVAAIDDLATWQPPYVSPRQFANYVGVSRRTVYYWIEKGALPAQKVEGYYLIPTDTARAYAKDILAFGTILQVVS